MQVVLFRHGIAEEREAFSKTGLPDSERPLTARGLRRTRAAAEGLRALVPELDAVGSSPYVRARQTADLIAHSYGVPAVDIVQDLQPEGAPLEICRWMERRAPVGAVALVGHEPDLSELLAWLTAGRQDGFARFKKAGACLIELPWPPACGQGELQWLLTPGVLRCVAGQDG